MALLACVLIGGVRGNGGSVRTSETDPLPTAVQTGPDGTTGVAPEGEWPEAWERHLAEVFPELGCEVEGITPPEAQGDGSGVWTASVVTTTASGESLRFAARYDPRRGEWATTLPMELVAPTLQARAEEALDVAGLAGAASAVVRPRAGKDWFVNDAKAAKGISPKDAMGRCAIIVEVDDAGDKVAVKKGAEDALRRAGFRYVEVVTEPTAQGED